MVHERQRRARPAKTSSQIRKSPVFKYEKVTRWSSQNYLLSKTIQISLKKWITRSFFFSLTCLSGPPEGQSCRVEGGKWPSGRRRQNEHKQHHNSSCVIPTSTVTKHTHTHTHTCARTHTHTDIYTQNALQPANHATQEHFRVVHEFPCSHGT